jgi:hypothetical protein
LHSELKKAAGIPIYGALKMGCQQINTGSLHALLRENS